MRVVRFSWATERPGVGVMVERGIDATRWEVSRIRVLAAGLGGIAV